MYLKSNLKKQNHSSRSAGFTLIEVLVSISIIALLSSVIMAATNSARKNARDSKRISSIRELQTGLELYFTDHQQYPEADTDEPGGLSSGDGLWDTPQDGDFLQVLVDEKYMQGTVFDPLDGSDDQYNLRYYRYPAGSIPGCPENRGAFYVLGVADMETVVGRHQLSPGWVCPRGEDFGDPDDGWFEFVVGKYES